jgi:hypothetical protein
LIISCRRLLGRAVQLTRRGRDLSIGIKQQLIGPRAAARREEPMANKHAQDLQRRIDAASENLSRQLHGMDAHMERADAPGEWTTREVLSHLLFEPGFDPAATLATFSERDYPVIEIAPGDTFLDEQRRQMTLSQFRDALGAQRRRVLEYIEGLEESAFEQRKARIPLFKQFMGTDEITIDMYLGAMFDFHWNDHAGQLEKIRQAVGLGSDAATTPGGVHA